MKIIPIDTPGAGTWARDCELLYLYQNYSSTPDYPGFRISYHRDEDDTYWEMYCTPTAYKVVCEELSRAGYLGNLPLEGGAFFEILDSPWIDELKDTGARFLERSRHFVLRFYSHSRWEWLNMFLVNKKIA